MPPILIIPTTEVEPIPVHPTPIHRVDLYPFDVGIFLGFALLTSYIQFPLHLELWHSFPKVVRTIGDDIEDRFPHTVAVHLFTSKPRLSIYCIPCCSVNTMCAIPGFVACRPYRGQSFEANATQQAYISDEAHITSAPIR